MRSAPPSYILSAAATRLSLSGIKYDKHAFASGSLLPRFILRIMALVSISVPPDQPVIDPAGSVRFTSFRLRFLLHPVVTEITCQQTHPGSRFKLYCVLPSLRAAHPVRSINPVSLQSAASASALALTRAWRTGSTPCHQLHRRPVRSGSSHCGGQFYLSCLFRHLTCLPSLQRNKFL